MNYTEITAALSSATGFDLFRIRSAIDRMLEDPQRIEQLRSQLAVDQEIEYFCIEQNRAVAATLVKFKRSWVVVRNIEDGRLWQIPYFSINIHGVDSQIVTQRQNQGLDRNEVKVGDLVGFLDRDNKEIYGKVVRLNPKTVSIHCPNGKWRVSYAFLLKVISPELDALPSKSD